MLSFSIILLNTDAHNPSIKKKMTKTQFINNHRGIVEGEELPQEYLKKLYDRIVRNEIKMEGGGIFVKGLWLLLLKELIRVL